MRQHFEKQIDEIKKKNKDAIEKLVMEFKQNLLKVQAEFNDSKSTGNNLKQHYDEKIKKQEDEHELEVIEIEERHTEKKQEKNHECETLRAQQAAQMAASLNAR